MKDPYSRGTKIACVAIAVWFAMVIVLALTVPFRQPPGATPSKTAR